MKTHELAENEFIGTVQIVKAPKNQQNPSLLQTIIVLDRSGSMGSNVELIVNNILPHFLSKLFYDDNQVVHLITFDTDTELFSTNIKMLETMKIASRRGTVMTPAVVKLQELLKTFDCIKPIRLLTISDGQVHDCVNVQSSASQLVEFLKKHNFSINSQVVRLFTGNSQPDTTALASLLQLNNTTTSILIDISSSVACEEIVDKMVDLFKTDNLDCGQTLTTKGSILLKYPWETSSSHLTLTPGDNLFWLKSIPDNETKINNNQVIVVPQQSLTVLKFQALMDNFIADHMRLLKIIGTRETENTVIQMLEYFEQKEDYLISNSLAVQIGLDWIHSKKISKVLDVIAKDDSIKSLDPAQKAEYLRQTGSSKENPTFVERLFATGIDIDSDESRKMIIVLLVLFAALFLSKIFGI